MSATKLAETRHRTLHRASKKIAVLATCQLVILHISLCGVSSQDSVVVAYTDTTQFVVGGTIFAYTEHDYHMFTERRSFVVKTKEKPAHLSNDTRFGYNLAYGGINRSWILDGNDVHGYMLYVDLNADGSLRNDAPLTFEHQGDSYSLVLKTTQKEIIDGKEQTYPVEIKLEITHAFHPGHKERRSH